MSCRSTPAGSLVTTFIQRAYGLHDAQCTSLFHEVRRETADVQGLPGGPLDASYRDHLTWMGSVIETSNRWTPALRARAVARVDSALTAGFPAPGLAAAVIAAPVRARNYRDALDTHLHRLARLHGWTDAQAQAEFDRLYGTFREARDNPSHIIFDVSVTGGPQDGATRYALGVMAHGRTCDTCGQFKSITAHTCPPAGHRPLQPAAPEPDSASPVSAVDWIAALGVVYDPVTDADTATDTPEPLATTPEAVSAAAGSTAAVDAWVGVVEPWHIDAFQDMYDTARASLASGSTTIPAIESHAPGDVTAGLGSRGTGNSFGIEIELDFPDDQYPYRARQEFARRLHAEGIVTAPFVQRWHHIGDDRPGGEYEENSAGWICEFDRSVDDVNGERGVEIKSQILYDEPATWYNISRICAIANELGAKPTPRTGLHVNVGGASFPSDDPSAHTALLRMAGAYDDTLVRLAHNPQSGPRHRGRAYCALAQVPPTGFAEVSTARAQSNHYQAFNLGHLPAAGQRHHQSSRVEVRVWDSATDLGRIQGAVNVSLAMVKLAVDGHKPGQGIEPAGSHRAAYGTAKLSGEAWEESTGAFRRMMTVLADAGLNTPAHQAMLTTMFAESRWQNA